MLHQTAGFQGPAICRCHWNLRQTDPGCHGNENLGILTEKMAKTRPIQKIEPQMLQQTAGFQGPAICQCHWNLRQTDPGCHGNENLGIVMEKSLKHD